MEYAIIGARRNMTRKVLTENELAEYSYTESAKDWYKDEEKKLDLFVIKRAPNVYKSLYTMLDATCVLTDNACNEMKINAENAIAIVQAWKGE